MTARYHYEITIQTTGGEVIQTTCKKISTGVVGTLVAETGPERLAIVRCVLPADCVNCKRVRAQEADRFPAGVRGGFR